MAATDREARIGLAAWRLGLDLEACEALQQGVPVPRRRLRRDVLAALDLPTEGEPIQLDAELALRIELLGPSPTEQREAHRTAPVEKSVDFPGLTHQEALTLEVPPVRQLVEGIIETGTLGTITGLPETHKSWLAMEIGLKVAGGGGSVLGRRVLLQGPVGYWWQDDSKANEAGRIQDYAPRHGYVEDLPIRWHLNEGLLLPDAIRALRAEVEREQQVLIVLDSFYKFLHGVRLKDEDAAAIFSQLKAEVCDPTGCTILAIDHSPWPTEGNQGQRRGYGSVFKAAASRWGIYLDRSADTLFVEARGNNLNGLKRTPVVWNAERLELQLVEAPQQPETMFERLTNFLRRNPGANKTVIKAGVAGRDAEVVALLEGDPHFTQVPPQLFGKASQADCWALAEDVPSLLNNPPRDIGPKQAESSEKSAQATDADLGPGRTTPVGGEAGPKSVVSLEQFKNDASKTGHRGGAA